MQFLSPLILCLWFQQIQWIALQDSLVSILREIIASLDTWSQRRWASNPLPSKTWKSMIQRTLQSRRCLWRSMQSSSCLKRIVILPLVQLYLQSKMNEQIAFLMIPSSFHFDTSLDSIMKLVIISQHSFTHVWCTSRQTCLYRYLLRNIVQTFWIHFVSYVFSFCGLG